MTLETQNPRLYLSNGLGFSEVLKITFDYIKTRITATGIIVLDPFEHCGKEINFAHLAELEASGTYQEVQTFWKEFNEKVHPINFDLMKSSDGMGAILDPDDVGVSNEMGEYPYIHKDSRKHPIFALRSDLRPGENIGTKINPQLLGSIKRSGGELISGPGSLERWFARLQKWREKFVTAQL